MKGIVQETPAFLPQEIECILVFFLYLRDISISSSIHQWLRQKIN